MTASIRAVFDCNIYFQALISPHGPSGRCMEAVLQGRALLFSSQNAIEELRSITMRPRIRAKFKRISDAGVESLIESIERVSTVVRHVPETFVYSRDPSDAHYVNLALATQAKYVVSRDNDLLDLMIPVRAEARVFLSQFPTLEIIEPPQFLRELDARDSLA